MQRNVLGHRPCISIERIQPFASGHPKRSLLVFPCRFDLVAAQTKGVVRIVTIADRPSGRRIERVEAAAGCQPQRTHMVLADVGYGTCFALRIPGIDAIVSKCLGNWVEFIEELSASDPQRTGTV